MPNDIEHERYRWQTMNSRQLQARLRKITDSRKLRNFLQLAEENGNVELVRMAWEKLYSGERPVYQGAGIRTYGPSPAWESRIFMTNSTNSPARSENPLRDYREAQMEAERQATVGYDKKKEGIRVIKIKKRGG